MTDENSKYIYKTLQAVADGVDAAGFAQAVTDYRVTLYDIQGFESATVQVRMKQNPHAVLTLDAEEVDGVLALLHTGQWEPMFLSVVSEDYD